LVNFLVLFFQFDLYAGRLIREYIRYMFSEATDVKMVVAQNFFLQHQVELLSHEKLKEVATDSIDLFNCMSTKEKDRYTRTSVADFIPKKFKIHLKEEKEEAKNTNEDNNHPDENSADDDDVNFIESVDFVSDNRKVTAHQFFKKTPLSTFNCKDCEGKSFNANGLSRHYK
jgi:hypothetical protein